MTVLLCFSQPILEYVMRRNHYYFAPFLRLVCVELNTSVSTYMNRKEFKSYKSSIAGIILGDTRMNLAERLRLYKSVTSTKDHRDSNFFVSLSTHLELEEYNAREVAEHVRDWMIYLADVFKSRDCRFDDYIAPLIRETDSSCHFLKIATDSYHYFRGIDHQNGFIELCYRLNYDVMRSYFGKMKRTVYYYREDVFFYNVAWLNEEVAKIISR